MITVSVPGKVILMGDHAVVYGKPGIVAAIDKRLRVTIEHASTGVTIVCDTDDSYIRTALSYIQKELQLPEKLDIKITVFSDIPVGYHLGTSAAVASAVIGATIYYYKKIWNPQQINQLTYEVEKIKHGTPSGIDNSSIIFGGLLWYRKELEVLRSIWQLPFSIHKNINSFYLLDTGKPSENTGHMVALVREKIAKYPKSMKRALDSNEQQTKRIALALKDGDEQELLDAIRVGERTLEKFGVVSVYAKKIIRSIEKIGGCAKILGGGGITHGVGYILCYLPKSIVLTSFAEQFGYPLVPIQLGQDGIVLEQKI